MKPSRLRLISLATLCGFNPIFTDLSHAALIRVSTHYHSDGSSTDTYKKEGVGKLHIVKKDATVTHVITEVPSGREVTIEISHRNSDGKVGRDHKRSGRICSYHPNRTVNENTWERLDGSAGYALEEMRQIHSDSDAPRIVPHEFYPHLGLPVPSTADPSRAEDDPC